MMSGGEGARDVSANAAQSVAEMLGSPGALSEGAAQRQLLVKGAEMKELGSVSVDGEEDVPRRLLDEVRASATVSARRSNASPLRAGTRRRLAASAETTSRRGRELQFAACADR
jgi:hypothetical protein